MTAVEFTREGTVAGYAAGAVIGLPILLWNQWVFLALLLPLVALGTVVAALVDALIATRWKR